MIVHSFTQLFGVETVLYQFSKTEHDGSFHLPLSTTKRPNGAQNGYFSGNVAYNNIEEYVSIIYMHINGYNI